jgi:hypothetical protein
MLSALALPSLFDSSPLKAQRFQHITRVSFTLVAGPKRALKLLLA